MKIIYKIITGISLSLLVVLCSGCRKHEVKLAHSLANSTSGVSSIKRAGIGSFKPHSSLVSPAAVSGMAQSQVIGAKMLMNPSVIGVGAVSMAISENNAARNREGYKKVLALKENPDYYPNRAIQAYNKKNGTHYKTIQEIQDALRSERYKKK